MLQIFRSYNPYAILVLFILTIGLKAGVLIDPEMVFVSGKSQFVWLKVSNIIAAMLGHSAFLITLFAVVNLFGQAIFLNRIANRHHLFPKSTYLPALSYILVTSLFKDWNYLSAALISNWLLLGALSEMLLLYAATDARKRIFNIGFFISLTALLVFPNIIFVGILFFALGILRPFKLAEWLVGCLGIITPFYFLVGVLFLTDHFNILRALFNFDFALPGKIKNLGMVISSFGFLLAIGMVGVYYLNYFMGRMLFQTKKWWWVVLASFFISLLAGIFTVAKGYNQWMAILIPCTFIIVNIWFEERRRWISSVLFYLFVAMVIFVQWQTYL